MAKRELSTNLKNLKVTLSLSLSPFNALHQSLVQSTTLSLNPSPTPNPNPRSIYYALSLNPSPTPNPAAFFCIFQFVHAEGCSEARENEERARAKAGWRLCFSDYAEQKMNSACFALVFGFKTKTQFTASRIFAAFDNPKLI
ncbi:hypothetical protein ACLOJK_012803 [Asimina triloba]